MIRRGGFFACLLLGAAVAAAGQTRDQNWEKCKADDPDTSIAGCTALIQAGPGNDRPIWPAPTSTAASPTVTKRNTTWLCRIWIRR